MKNKSLNYLLYLLVIVFFIGGCKGLADMQKEASKIKYEIKPNPLEMHPTISLAEKVTLTITGTFPPKYFNKKAIVVGTPVLKYANGEKELTPLTLQGEKIKDNNKTISWENGGNFEYKAEFDYTDDMRLSELVLNVKASKGAESVNLDPYKLADGIVTTPRLARYSFAVDNTYGNNLELAKLATAEVKLADKSTSVYEADIHYVIQQSAVRKEELKAQDILDLENNLNQATANNLTYLGTEVKSYASPDGPTDLNTDLSSKRGKTANEYLTKQFGKSKISATGIQVTPTAEDWAGFQTELDKANVRDKDLIKRVLSMYQDPEVREKEIKNISEAYEELKTTVLPQLRRSQLAVKFETKKKSDEEIMKLAESKPDYLNETELFYAATLTNDLNKKVAIYENFIKQYPKDWRGPNNLGVVYVYKNDLTAAKRAFEQANSLEKNEFTLNNIGVIELSGKNIEKAEKYFNDAEKIRPSAEVSYNLGYIFLVRGEYADAVKKFGASNSYAAALASLLNKNVDQALAKINGMDSKSQAHPMAQYLKAVVGARKGDVNIMFNSLEAAVKADPKLKAYAKEDIEFGKYFTEARFKTIVGS